MNTVVSLKSSSFSSLSLEEKLHIKSMGADRPDINHVTRCNRKFMKTWYDKYPWLTGCSQSGAVYCFPCLLFDKSGKEIAWTTAGVNDWRHFIQKANLHGKASSHVENSVKLAVLGKSDIASQLSAVHRERARKHNAEVDHNRYILSRMIDCIKFCGAFELSLRGHDESEESGNPGVFMGLVNFTAFLDPTLRAHLDTATVFRGTSKTIQNELLEIMLSVLQKKIKEEIKESSFLSVIADDTSDVTGHLVNAVVFRYLKGKQIVERFWTFHKLQQGTAESISSYILSSLKLVLPNPEDKEKLIAQCYDGASVMSGSHRGVQSLVKEIYPMAHYVHCYAHQLNLAVQQALNGIRDIRIFFSNLQGFSSFFAHSPKRLNVLDEIVARRIPRTSVTRWNFSSRIVATLYENKENLIACFQHIIANWEDDRNALREAGGLLNWMHDTDFLFLLSFFYKVLPHVDILYNQLQKRSIEPAFIQYCLEGFAYAVNNIRNNISNYLVEYTCPAKRRRLNGSSMSQTLHEVCDVLLEQCRTRFKFTGHLVASSLLVNDKFPEFEKTFPSQLLKYAVQAYPLLDEKKLRSELLVVYSREEFRGCCGALALLHFITDCNLIDALSETVKLIQILITTPMTSSEAERCFSTLKRIKTFLRNTMAEERLTALAMLSMEKDLIREMPTFNQQVVDSFASRKERRAKFLYK